MVDGMTREDLDSCESGSCWYAWLISNYEKVLSPEREENKSSTRGRGYLLIQLGGTIHSKFKSPQMRMDVLSAFRIGTIGAAHDENCTGSNTLSCTSRSSSSSTSTRME